MVPHSGSATISRRRAPIGLAGGRRVIENILDLQLFAAGNFGELWLRLEPWVREQGMKQKDLCAWTGLEPSDISDRIKAAATAIKLACFQPQAAGAVS